MRDFDGDAGIRPDKQIQSSFQPKPNDFFSVPSLKRVIDLWAI